MKRIQTLLQKAKNKFIQLPKIGKAAIIIAVIAVLTVGAYLSFGKKTASVQYQTAQVEKGSVISTLSGSGNVASGNQTKIYSPTDGLIQETYVKNGDVVAAGQELFKVKSTATEQEKASSYASYLSALSAYQSAVQGKQAQQASLETARKSVLDAQVAVDTMDRNLSTGTDNPSTKQAYTQNEKDSIYSTLITAKQNFTATETKYKQADTSIGAASASQTSAWLNYEATQDTVVTAPIAGTVANFSYQIGAAVTGAGTNNSSTSNSSSENSGTSNATTVLIIGDFTQLSLTAQVSEVDVTKIKAQQKATITLDALPDKTYAGQVASVDTVGTSTSGVVTYNAYIVFTSPPPEIQPGMTATAVIQLDRADDVLTVPNSAVQTTDGVSYVQVMQNGQPTSVEVQTGLVSDDATQIVSGLKEGQTIVTSTISSAASSSTSTTSPFGGTRGMGGASRTSGGGGNAVFIQR